MHPASTLTSVSALRLLSKPRIAPTRQTFPSACPFYTPSTISLKYVTSFQTWTSRALLRRSIPPSSSALCSTAHVALHFIAEFSTSPVPRCPTDIPTAVRIDLADACAPRVFDRPPRIGSVRTHTRIDRAQHGVSAAALSFCPTSIAQRQVKSAPPKGTCDAFPRRSTLEEPLSLTTLAEVNALHAYVPSPSLPIVRGLHERCSPHPPHPKRGRPSLSQLKTRATPLPLSAAMSIVPPASSGAAKTRHTFSLSNEDARYTALRDANTPPLPDAPSIVPRPSFGARN